MSPQAEGDITFVFFIIRPLRISKIPLAKFPAIAELLELPHDIHFRQQSLDGRAISVASELLVK
jgi:hypothetical protein